MISIESWVDRASAWSWHICAKLAKHQHSSCTVSLCLSLRSKQGLIALMTLCTSDTTGDQKGWRLPKEQHSFAPAKSSQLKQ